MGSMVRQRKPRKSRVSALEALPPWSYVKLHPTVKAPCSEFRSTVKLLFSAGACIAVMLLLVVPLLTLEADARGGGGGGGHCGCGQRGREVHFRRGGAGVAGGLVALRCVAGREGVPSGGRVSVGRISEARVLQLVRSKAAAQPRVLAALASGSLPPRPARATSVAGCSATVPSLTWLCDRN